jgi:hypothetical protein
VRKAKGEQKQAVTAEDAERMYAQAWPGKLQQVKADLDAAAREVGERHKVIIAIRAEILPAFLAGQAAPVAAKLPGTPPAPPQEV